MINSIRGEILEQYHEPMTNLHWKRNKKPNVNLTYDSAFATDRQLEDQRYMLEMNKNPRAFEMTKADKPRSIKITQKKGNASALGIKSKVVNKIVREASGVHNYTLIPPIQSKTKEKMSHDPNTNPLMKPYIEQASVNPIMCSFGHRPKSASRTFHPGTMKVRMSKGEIASVPTNGRNGFGLPPYVLQKILNAPKLHPPNTYTDSDIDTNAKRYDDPNDLFLSHDDLFGDGLSRTSPASLGKNEYVGGGGNRKPSKSKRKDNNVDSSAVFHGANDSLYSDVQESAKNVKILKPITVTKSKPPPIDEANWDNHWHHEVPSANYKFEVKKSGIAENKVRPLKERLTRYAEISVRETAPQPFCVEKKETDRLVNNGLYKKENSTLEEKMQNPYFDPQFEEEIRDLNRRRRRKDEEAQKRIKQKLLQEALRTIPKVTYHPDALVVQRAMDDDSLTKSRGTASYVEELGSPTDSLTLGDTLTLGDSSAIRSTTSSRSKKIREREGGKFGVYGEMEVKSKKKSPSKISPKNKSKSNISDGEVSPDDSMFEYMFQNYGNTMSEKDIENNEAEKLRILEQYQQDLTLGEGEDHDDGIIYEKGDVEGYDEDVLLDESMRDGIATGLDETTGFEEESWNDQSGELPMRYNDYMADEQNDELYDDAALNTNTAY